MNLVLTPISHRTHGRMNTQEYTEPNRTMLTYVEGTMKKGKHAGDVKGIKVKYDYPPPPPPLSTSYPSAAARLNAKTGVILHVGAHGR